MVKVMGVRTFETVPGLNRHLRNALVAALSKIALPVLCCMSALVTDPLPVSTVITQTPLPVIFDRRASYGYSGRGALIATAFADDIDIGPALGKPAGFGRAIGATGFVVGGLLGGGVGFSSTNSGTSVGSGGTSTGSGSTSSGGGVGSGAACSNVTSATASGIWLRSAGCSSGFNPAMTTAVK